MLKPDHLCDAVKIECGIPNVPVRQDANLTGDSIDSLIRQVFRRSAPAANEDLYQARPYLLVSGSSAVAVRVEPQEKLIQALAR
jgi:hypothetical protein